MAALLLRLAGDSALPRVVSYLESASRKGDAKAAERLLSLILRPGTSGYDPERAADIVRGAVDNGRFDVLPSHLSAVADAGPAPRALLDGTLDMPLIHRAAETGDPAAMRRQGVRLRDGAEDAATLADGMDWLAQAAEAGDARAMVAMGEALAFCAGLPRDRKRALDWLDRAARLGNRKAAEIMRLVRLSQRS